MADLEIKTSGGVNHTKPPPDIELNEVGNSNDNVDADFNLDEQEVQVKVDSASSEGGNNVMDDLFEILDKQR